MATRANLLCDIFRYLGQVNVGFSELMLFVLVQHQFDDIGGAIMKDLTANAMSLLSALFYHPATSTSTHSWAQQAVLTTTHKSVQELSRKEHEWHFNATHKAIVIISILLHNKDQRCNLLQSTFGKFLQSCSVPEKLIKILAQMGISISLTSIRHTIHSLSDGTEENMKALGRSLTSRVGYDNFDFKLDIAIPMLESRKDSLFDMTSTTLLRLKHSVHPEHLQCSRLLWNRSKLNPSASRAEPPVQSGLTGHSRFRAWHFQHILFKHGPLLLKGQAGNLWNPEAIEPIPVVKLPHVPLRTMDINQSKLSGNIEALGDMLRQAGLRDPSHLTMTQTGMRVEDILDMLYSSRVSFTSAANAIWCLLVAPTNVQLNSTSFAKLVGKLHPNKSSRLINNTKFRQQHELIEHVGSLLQLDAWHVKVTKSSNGCYQMLKEWAASKPSAHKIAEIADHVALQYTEGEDVDMYELQWMAFSKDLEI
ncbi:hypothetical protein NUW54_g4358 [Trametes sanguinea]|uniref:Uncharacterized protein n=1 Tax=Trametes sanguinea TaxID=158606 RepID=A0ACC1Q182_9APHY|nr:hypothetical protein NUW54_g4358 [Trametes sanguinea]